MIKEVKIFESKNPNVSKMELFYGVDIGKDDRVVYTKYEVENGKLKFIGVMESDNEGNLSSTTGGERSKELLLNI